MLMRKGGEMETHQEAVRPQNLCLRQHLTLCPSASEKRHQDRPRWQHRRSLSSKITVKVLRPQGSKHECKQEKALRLQESNQESRRSTWMVTKSTQNPLKKETWTSMRSMSKMRAGSGPSYRS